ncbi:hypothetical protein EV426DRAFT_684647 [Tirmania nivea]|nr:hypothetical protein EV426DRAFT_684647 [Tirmania nivea]
MFNYNRASDRYVQDYVRHPTNRCSPFAYEAFSQARERSSFARETFPQVRESSSFARQTFPQVREPSSSAQSHRTLLVETSGPLWYTVTTREAGAVERFLLGEDWLGRSFDSLVLNPILDVCKKCFRKCFWSMATLLSLCAIINSVYSIATNLLAFRLGGIISIFISVFKLLMPIFLLWAFIFAFSYCKEAEPEALPWMWYQVTTLYKTVIQILRPSQEVVISTWQRFTLWILAGLPTTGLSQWFANQFRRLGNQFIRFGKTIGGEIEATSPQITIVSMVSTAVQTEPDAATTAGPSTPPPQRAPAVVSMVSTAVQTEPDAATTAGPSTPPPQRAPAVTSSLKWSTQTKTLNTHGSTTTNASSKAARMPTQFSTTPSTTPVKKQATSSCTTGTQTTTVTTPTTTNKPIIQSASAVSRMSRSIGNHDARISSTAINVSTQTVCPPTQVSTMQSNIPVRKPTPASTTTGTQTTVVTMTTTSTQMEELSVPDTEATPAVIDYDQLLVDWALAFPECNPESSLLAGNATLPNLAPVVPLIPALSEREFEFSFPLGNVPPPNIAPLIPDLSERGFEFSFPLGNAPLPNPAQVLFPTLSDGDFQFSLPVVSNARVTTLSEPLEPESPIPDMSEEEIESVWAIACDTYGDLFDLSAREPTTMTTGSDMTTAQVTVPNVEQVAPVEERYVEAEMTDMPEEIKQVVEEDEAMSEAPSSETPDIVGPAKVALTSEVNVEMSDVDVQVEAPGDKAMADADAGIAHKDHNMSNAQEEPAVATTCPAPTFAAPIPPIVPIVLAQVPTTTTIPATDDNEMVDQPVAQQFSAENQGVQGDSNVVVPTRALPRLPRSYGRPPRANLPALRVPPRPSRQGAPGYRGPLSFSAGPMTAAATATTTTTVVTTTMAPALSNTAPVSNPTSAISGPLGVCNNSAVTDEELADILLRAICG